MALGRVVGDRELDHRRRPGRRRHREQLAVDDIPDQALARAAS